MYDELNLPTWVYTYVKRAFTVYILYIRHMVPTDYSIQYLDSARASEATQPPIVASI
jgi:hypothetical protein